MAGIDPAPATPSCQDQNSKIGASAGLVMCRFLARGKSGSFPTSWNDFGTADARMDSTESWRIPDPSARPVHSCQQQGRPC